MKANTFLILIAFPALLSGQVTVKGIVTEQNSGNKPLAGVQIKAMGTAPESTGNDGLFKLAFASKKPGDHIIVSEISKKGYEIVNKNVLDNWVVPNDPDYRMKIVMCPEGLIAQNRIRYYDISLAGLTKGYQEKIKKLQEERDQALIDANAFALKSKQLSDQFNAQQQQLEELADKFARQNFDDCSSIHQRAFEAFSSGDIEAAVRILESVNSEEEIEKAVRQKEKASAMITQSDSVIHQNISKLIFQADLYCNMFRFSDAEKAYQTAIQADNLNFDPLFQYTLYLYHQQRYQESLKWGTKALELARTEPDKADVLLTNAISLNWMNRYKEAGTAYRDALAIWRVLASTSPQLYNAKLSLALNSMANFYSNINQKDSAESCYNEAIALRRALIPEEPEAHSKQLAICLTNLALLQKQMLQYDKAEANFQEAIAVRRELMKLKAPLYRFDLAWSIFGYAQLKVLQGNLDQAGVLYSEATTLMRDVAGSNPERYRSYLARVLMGYSYMKMAAKELQEAEALCTEALALTRDLVAVNPTVFSPIYAMNLLHYAMLEEKLDKAAGAEENFTKSISIYRELVKDNPGVYSRDLSGALFNSAHFHINMKQLEKAEAEYLEEIGVLRGMPWKTRGVEMNRHFFLALIEYGKLMLGMGKTAEAEAAFWEASPVGDSLVNENPKANRGPVAHHFGSYGYSLIQSRQFGLAEKSVRKGLEVDSTQTWMNTNLALALLFQGKYPEAEKVYVQYKDLPYPDDPSKLFRDFFLADIEELEKAGVTHPDVERIRKLLTK